METLSSHNKLSSLSDAIAHTGLSTSAGPQGESLRSVQEHVAGRGLHGYQRQGGDKVSGHVFLSKGGGGILTELLSVDLALCKVL